MLTQSTNPESWNEFLNLLENHQVSDIARIENRSRVDATLTKICEQYYDIERTSGSGDLSWPLKSEIVEKKAVVNGAIIPVTHDFRHLLDQFIQWSTLYTDLSIFVLPSRIETTNIMYSAIGDSHAHIREDISELFSYNKKYKALVKGGKGIFLPTQRRKAVTSYTYHTIDDYTAPLVQRPESYIFTPLNAKNNIFSGKAYQDFWIYKDIVLPFFKGVSIEELIKIAKNETDVFLRFNHFLTQRLKNISRATAASQLLEISDEIDYQIRGLKIEIDKLRRIKLLQAAELTFFTISISALLFSNLDLLKQTAGLLGSINLYQLLKDYSSYSKDKLDLKKNDFYLPYLLSTKEKE